MLSIALHGKHCNRVVFSTQCPRFPLQSHAFVLEINHVRNASRTLSFLHRVKFQKIFNFFLYLEYNAPICGQVLQRQPLNFQTEYKGIKRK